MKNKVLVIVGPTASGKSDLAVRLAKKFNGEVISADSRQVYKGLNIGSGKITKKEMQGVPHHLLDVADPKKQFSAAEFKSKAEKVISMIYHTSRLPIVVGGTGFYIDALTGTVTLPEVPPNKLLREKLDKLSKVRLYSILEKKDPARAKAIDPRNKVRVIRALEIVNALGKVPIFPQDGPVHRTVLGKQFIYIGLKPDQQELEERINARLLRRLPGMIREMKSLHEKGLTYKRMHELGFEYGNVAKYLQGQIGRKELFENICRDSLKYAKRQMTYFRRNKKIKWFTLSGVERFRSKEYKNIEKYLKGKL
jgi:tRNA dimethylallyltransferase